MLAGVRRFDFLLPLACSSSFIPTKTSVYAAFHANNQECMWIITALSQHQVIRFTFKGLNMAQSGDYVEIRDGSNSSAVVLKNFTNKQYKKWRSRGNNLWIKSKSDKSIACRFFRMAWKFVNSSEGRICMCNVRV